MDVVVVVLGVCVLLFMFFGVGCFIFVFFSYCIIILSRVPRRDPVADLSVLQAIPGWQLSPVERATNKLRGARGGYPSKEPLWRTDALPSGTRVAAAVRALAAHPTPPDASQETPHASHPEGTTAKPGMLSAWFYLNLFKTGGMASFCVFGT